MRKIIAAAFVLALSGCGAYQPSPLPTPSIVPTPVPNPAPTPPPIIHVNPYLELSVQGVSYNIVRPTPTSPDRCIDPTHASVVLNVRVVGFDPFYYLDWNYGDGVQSLYHTSPSTAHTYLPAVSSWTATVTVYDAVHSLSQTVAVVLPTKPPALDLPFCP